MRKTNKLLKQQQRQSTVKCHCAVPFAVISQTHTHTHTHTPAAKSNCQLEVQTERVQWGQRALIWFHFRPILSGLPLIFLLQLHKPAIQYIMPLWSPKGDGQIYSAVESRGGAFSSSSVTSHAEGFPLTRITGDPPPTSYLHWSPATWLHELPVG